MTKFLAATAALVLTAGAASAATIVFEEDFDDEAIGVPSATPGAFTVNSGTVDVIGEDSVGNTSFDFFPGNGLYVDLNGTPGPAEIETASLGLVVGQSYTLTFDYAFNLNSGNNEVLGFEVGDFSGSIDLNGEPAAFQTYSVTFLYTGGDDTLLFADNGATPGDNGGPLIDNISLAAVPLPAAGLLLLGALGAVGLARRRKA